MVSFFTVYLLYYGTSLKQKTEKKVKIILEIMQERKTNSRLV